MIHSPLSSPLLAPLVSDLETAAMFSGESAVRSMLDFEVALAAVEERLGLIPGGSAEKIAAAADEVEPDLAGLGRGSAQSGHPVAALVQRLRKAAGPARDYVHHGATAQDVIDTSLVLRLAEVLELLDRRLEALIRQLAGLAREHRDSVMAGRTRTQHAVPVTFGLKVASWLLPLGRHRRRLAEMRPRVLAVQLGGAAGTLGTLGPAGVRVMEELAIELGLRAPPTPWHSQRDGMAEAAGWLSLVTGSLAKMGKDLTLLVQSEVGEAQDGSAGTSSAMPHKANPVRSETLVAIGRANAGHLSSMHHAAIHGQERSGSPWTLEWLTLPQMTVLTGAALRLALDIAGSLQAEPGRMLRNVARSHELLLAEAAAFGLAPHTGISEARRIVADASKRCTESGPTLIDILQSETTLNLPWEDLRDPARLLESVPELIDRAVRDAQRTG